TSDGAGCRAQRVPSRNNVAGHLVTATVQPTGLVALTADPSGPTGDFSATPLAASATWNSATSTGDFSWSYPLRVPPAVGGPVPDVALAYTSGSVDGRTAASNNQPSWVGEGWDLWSGYVERRYKACADDLGGGANNTVKTGDLCWGTDNAVLSLGRRAVELVRDGATGVWHPRIDDGSRV